MLATDFIYDDIKLSDKGYMICDFDEKSGAEIINVGSKITFNKIKRDSGRIYTLASATYDECISATFDICKDEDYYYNNGNKFKNVGYWEFMQISNLEFRGLMQWLNRREFLPFRIVDKKQTVCWYNASFNIEKIVIGGNICGARLTMETDRPFGYDDKVTIKNRTLNNSNPTIKVVNTSNEIGYLYPIVKLKCLADGNLTLTNTLENSTTIINKCSNSEVITLNGETQTIITTNENNHTKKKIHNDFNWEFPRLAIKMKQGQVIRDNDITSSLPCEITIEYSPIVKDVP